MRFAQGHHELHRETHCHGVKLLLTIDLLTTYPTTP